MYKVTVTEDEKVVRYEQTVDTLDIKAVIDAVNRGSIVRKTRTRRNRAEDPVEAEA